MAKREFLQLAHKYDPKKCGASGWYASEKLDGQRAFYDGGITYGMLTRDVPWANVAKDKKVFKATGLWSRGGKAIFAPDWFLAKLPKMPLDGELYAGRGNFQLTESIVRDHIPGPEWSEVKYMVFDTPPVENMFANGEIDTIRFQKIFKGFVGWVMKRLDPKVCAPPTWTFETRLRRLKATIGEGNEVCQLHKQEMLPYASKAAQARVEELMTEFINAGGEGVILKNPSQYWLPERSYAIVKHKPWDDAEAIVDGYTWGDETDKGSKLLGMMGAIWLKNENGRFKCSGFKDNERQMVDVTTGESAHAFGSLHPKEDAPPHIHNPKFPRGTSITYKFRELTDANLPKEARYYRIASE